MNASVALAKRFVDEVSVLKRELEDLRDKQATLVARATRIRDLLSR